MLTKAALVVQEWMPHVYTSQRTLRVVNPDGQEKELMLNEPVIDDKTGAVMKMYDMQSAKVDVKIVIGSTRAKSPAADLQRDLTLLNAGIYDRTQVIMNMQGDLDKSSLIARHSEIQQLRGALEQMEGQLKQLQGDMQTREREIFHANMRAEIAEATKSTSQAVSNIKANAKLEEARQRDASKKVKEGASSVLNAINSQTAAPAQG
jgi:TolA-binding protein